jgi:hypothetical protein
MKNEAWELFKFVVKLNVRYFPRLFISPLVGAMRGVWAEADKMDAEFDEFVAKQDQRLAERNPTRSLNA